MVKLGKGPHSRYSKKDSRISRTKDGPGKVEWKQIKSWKVRLFQIMEALEAEVRSSVAAERR